MSRQGMPERFWSKVDASAGESQCWPWTASRNEAGYGWFQIGGKMRRAHTIAYRLTKGDPPEGHIIRHVCDNPPCCNPAHLVSGTKKDNALDASERGRYRPRHGENNPRAFLTEEIVRYCRSRVRRKTKKDGIAALARELGVSEPALRDAVNRRSWKHVK